MKVRGERECQDCGTRWSYFETGDVSCPDCDSLRSVAVDEERTRHTDAPADLDLTPYRSALADDADPSTFATNLERDCRTYLRRRGFVHAGDLRPLDDRYLAVRELLTAVVDYDRDRKVGVDYGVDSDDVERYLLSLVAGADAGERPTIDEVPEPMTAARGLAYATAVDDYREEVATYLDDHPDEGARRVLGRIRDQTRRVEALDGDVPPATVETLVRACRDVHSYLDGDEEALAAATDRLDSLP